MNTPAGPGPTRPRIYLAGPDVFHREREAIFGSLKAACAALGFEGLAPIDGGPGEDFAGTDDERARRIYEANLRLIRAADGVIANLADFRGSEPDSGTVFEVGFAVALGKPVAVYGVGPGSYAERVARRIACVTDASGTVRELASGITVEGLGQRLNLMLNCSTGMADDAAGAIRLIAAALGHRASAARDAS